MKIKCLIFSVYICLKSCICLDHMTLTYLDFLQYDTIFNLATILNLRSLKASVIPYSNII